MSDIHDEKKGSMLFNQQNIRNYIFIALVLLGITCLYYVIFGISSGMINQSPTGNNLPINGPPPGNNPPTGNIPPASGIPTGNAGTQFNLWPLWGQFVLPSINEVIFSIAILSIFIILSWYFYQKKELNLNLIAIIIGGIVLITGTNLIHGWQTGIESSIGGASEILTDAVNVDNIFTFISNYVDLQSTLSVHAQTQPPGAVLVIYLLHTFLGNPGLIAIALCAICTLFTVFFVRGIYDNYFDRKLSNYAVFLLVLLPAIQVYYLANIYAVVSSLFLGVIYFYLHHNHKISIIGSMACLVLGLFTSFLFAYAVIFLLFFELSSVWFIKKLDWIYIRKNGILDWIKSVMESSVKLITVLVTVVTSFVLLFILTGFNYIDAFLFASNLENPNGFMLFADPVNYLLTRIQNILDILIFFGPVLIVICYLGLERLRRESSTNEHSLHEYLLVLSAIAALLILFFAGAPKKGETARICMFILPVLLIPVIRYIERDEVSGKDKMILASLVFGQTVLMQLFGSFVW